VSPRRPLPAGIRRRGAVFTYTWRDHTGRQYSRKAGDTLPEAEAFKRRIDGQLALGRYQATSTVTFASYAASWIEIAPLKEQTRYRYRGILRTHVLPAFGSQQLAKIHPHQVRGRVAEQVAGPLSASSIRQNIAVLRSCLKAAQIDGHLDTLPLLGVRMPRAHSRQPAVLTLEEAFAMVEAAPAEWQCAIATALFTGLRLGELLGLTRADIDLPGRRRSVRATLTEVSGRSPRLLREEPKSRAGYRQVPIVEALAVRLEAHLDALGPTDEDVVFASPVGTLMSKSNFYRDAWLPTRAAAARENLTFHDLRHTAASLLLAHSGAELAELKFVLGHSQIAHTVDLYGHLVPGRLEGLRSTFDAAVQAARGPEPDPLDFDPGMGEPHERRLRLVT
jgi:integrase